MSTHKTTKKNESKRSTSKNKRHQKLRQLLIQVGLGALSVLFLLASFGDVRTYQGLQEALGSNRRLLIKTKEEEEQLELTKRNLTNPDYLEFVARGRYYASRPGEQVFVFPQLAQEYSQANDDFYDDELLREEEANKKQSLQQATQPSSQTPQNSQSQDSQQEPPIESTETPSLEQDSSIEASIDEPAPEESVINIEGSLDPTDPAA